MSTLRRPLLVLPWLALLAACGGGGGTVPGDPPAAATPSFADTYRYAALISAAPNTLRTHLGEVTPDGSGTLSGVIVRNVNGAIAPPIGLTPFAYVVEPDGALTWRPSATPDLVEIQGGLGVGGRVGVLGYVLPGDPPGIHVLTKPEGGHSDASLAGTYHWGGYFSLAPDEAATFWGGTVVFDGAGGAETTLHMNAEGVTGDLEGPFPATYAVDPDGTVTFTFDTVVLRGGLLAGPGVAVLGGGTLPGNQPTLMVFVAASAGATDARFAGRYFVAGFVGGAAEHTSVAGTATADGGGEVTLGVTENVEGMVATPPSAAASYVVGPDGSLSILGGDAPQGAISRDGRFGFLTGGTTPGSTPMIYLLCR